MEEFPVEPHRADSRDVGLQRTVELADRVEGIVDLRGRTEGAGPHRDAAAGILERDGVAEHADAERIAARARAFAARHGIAAGGPHRLADPGLDDAGGIEPCAGVGGDHDDDRRGQPGEAAAVASGRRLS